MKKILGIYDAPGQHWVGDGFPARTLFSYNSHGRHMSPFLLLDYAGPASFTPTTDRRGVGEHPHRGFETVTIVYQGEVQHRDSTGAGGTIGPGDVQWMTAGAGILHEEFHSQAFARSGGTLDMVQLWVNLPAKDKMTTPRYQTLLRQDIPVVDLPEGAGSLRVIAGEYGGRMGPAHTFSPMDVWDLRLQQGRSTSLAFKAGRTAALVVLRGTVQVNGSEIVREAQLVMLDRDAGEVVLEASSDATLLVLSGEPLNEPIVGYGPFVMNSEAQIAEALDDFNSGRFGRIAPLDPGVNPMSTPANFNGAKPIIDPANAAMLLIDHQSGLFQTIQDMPFTEVRTNATTLAKVASLARIPVITSASVPQGPNGPLIPEIHKYAPHAQYVARRGEINAWDSPEFVTAVKATGKKQLIIAATITSVCMAFPSIAAVHDGYQVFAVVDASGTYSKMAQEITLARVVQAGVVPMDTAAVCSEIQRSGTATTPRSGPKSMPRCFRPTSC